MCNAIIMIRMTFCNPIFMKIRRMMYSSVAVNADKQIEREIEPALLPHICAMRLVEMFTNNKNIAVGLDQIL